MLKAKLKSRRIKRERRPESAVKRRSFVVLIKALSVLREGMSRNGLFYKLLVVLFD